MSRFFPLLIAMLLFPVSTLKAEERPLWFYLQTNLLVDENVDRAVKLVDRAAAAGYNGILVADSKFSRWDGLPDRYVKNVRRFRQACRDANIRCFAAVCPVGYSNDLLSRDPNLAEGLPVVGAPFVVRDGRIVPEPFETPLMKNGGFEEFRNDNPVGWGFVDRPGEVSFRDTQVRHEGGSSLRMQDIGIDEPSNGRAMQAIAVKPFRYYHLSVMVKTEDFEATGAMNIAVLAPDGRSLNWHMPQVERTQDWKRLDITFNSLDNETLNLYLGTWGGRRGKVWWDDVRIEPAGFVNVLRREGTPLTLRSEDGKTVYVEDEDFTRITDPLLGNDPYGGCFTAWHAPPEVLITKTGRLSEGQRVLVDYYHGTIIYGEQVGCCICEPKTLEILRWQIGQVREHLDPDGYFLSHDEIRQMGFDKSCIDSGKTPAEMLADNVAACVEMVRREAPCKPIAVWSDMFDPTHNARKDGKYYLVKGDGPWYGSWKKLPQDVIVANWNFGANVRKESLAHFDTLGNPQILAGYYDAEPVDEPIRAWMRDAAAFPSVRGAMYTTWTNNYDHLEKFAEAVRKEGERQKTR